MDERECRNCGEDYDAEKPTPGDYDRGDYCSEECEDEWFSSPPGPSDYEERMHERRQMGFTNF